MPSPAQFADDAHDRASYPEIKERIGEDPADWLDRDLIETGPRHTDRTMRRHVVARIRGIDKLGVVNAWIHVERDLDRGPRAGIMQLLEQRRDWLIEHGSRPDLLEEKSEDWPDRYRRPADRDVPDRTWYWVGPDGERVPYAEKRASSAQSKVSRLRAGDQSDQPAATEGGEA